MSLHKLIPMLLLCFATGAAVAKLPPPPPVDPAVAEAAKKKAAEAAKKAAEAQARAEDRVVERYKREKGAGGAAKAVPVSAPAAAKK
jgi:hypothetical protein